MGRPIGQFPFPVLMRTSSEYPCVPPRASVPGAGVVGDFSTREGEGVNESVEDADVRMSKVDVKDEVWRGDRGDDLDACRLSLVVEVDFGLGALDDEGRSWKEGKVSSGEEAMGGGNVKS